MLTYGINQLSANAAKIEALVQDIPTGQARWKPDPQSWSVLEVINHLYDEELEDFPQRLKHILNQTAADWPPIDPQGWVAERAYNERELTPSLANFLEARQKSIIWLKTLETPDWQLSYEAPWGPITAGDMFAAWVAHDLLHLRQLVELLWAYNSKEVVPYTIRYAGDW